MRGKEIERERENKKERPHSLQLTIIEEKNIVNLFSMTMELARNNLV